MLDPKIVPVDDGFGDPNILLGLPNDAVLPNAGAPPNVGAAPKAGVPPYVGAPPNADGFGESCETPKPVCAIDPEPPLNDPIC